VGRHDAGKKNGKISSAGRKETEGNAEGRLTQPYPYNNTQ
jgi:hypothetical protein